MRAPDTGSGRCCSLERCTAFQVPVPPIHEGPKPRPMPSNAYHVLPLPSTPSVARVDDWNGAFNAQFTAMKVKLEEITQGQAELKSALSVINGKLDLLPAKVSPEVVISPRIADVVRQPTPVSEPGALLQTNAEVRRCASMKEVSSLISLNNEATERNTHYLSKLHKASCVERLRMVHLDTKDLILDAIFNIVIMSNALFIGISADNWDGNINVYFFVDAAFALFFYVELLIKLNLHGFAQVYCGSDKYSNIFDVTLIFLDTIQLGLVFSKKATETLQEAGVPSASLFRSVRLVRVARILRLLRHPAFIDMLRMLEGTLSGMRTLIGAFVLFAVMVYIVALLCKEFFSDERYADVYLYFKTVPRSMYTVFRCSFGDCSTASGQPLPEFIHEAYGVGGSLLVGFYIFFISIGLFNVISAVFVDITMSRAAEENHKKMQYRFADQELWATSVCAVVRRCLIKANMMRDSDDATLDDSVLSQQIPRFVVDEVVQHDKEALHALDELDIHRDDHRKLADILDPDHSGTIEITEIINGLQRLRGDPRRSDVVVIDLMVRAVQEKLDDILAVIMENAAQTMGLHAALTNKRAALEDRLVKSLYVPGKPSVKGA